jgi:NAD(P)-dependent dehydrogenase (short-subunit alcohol dehydrogenase family)
VGHERGKTGRKIALITGGTSGIGLATAKRFVNEGAYVYITGRRDPELMAAVKEIGHHLTGVRGDVSTLADLDRLFTQIAGDKGWLDVVFANAGVARYASLDTIYRGVLRCDLRRERQGPPVHGAKGPTTDAGWRVENPQCVNRWQQGLLIE